MTENTTSERDDWNPSDHVAWEEFKKRMDSQPYLEFYPRAEDLRMGEYRGIGVSLAIWARHVLFTLPLDIIRAIWNVFKGVGLGVASLAALLMSPFMMLLHRLLLTLAAITGRLWIVPHNRSIAEHLNYRLNTIRKEMESEGYNLDKFFHEVDVDEISAETRDHLLRRWPG